MFIVFDIECYWNYFHVSFLSQDGTVRQYTRLDDIGDGDLPDIWRQVADHTLVSFNGNNYDILILSMALSGATNKQMKQASDGIIVNRLMPWDVERKFGFTRVPVDHIDIMQLLPLQASLKVYGARHGTKRLQDLPIDPDAMVTPETAAVLNDYCLNGDCVVTWELFIERWPVIDLRYKMGEQYGLDLRSKSDAQIAEAVMKAEYKRITHRELRKPIDTGDMPTEVTYIPPPFLKLQDKELHIFMTELMEDSFQLHPTNGKPIAPAWLKDKKICIGSKTYTVGLGGLHSVDKGDSYYSTPGWQILDIDVASFYPRIIQVCGYKPAHMGDVFTSIYDKIIADRLTAKHAGAVDAALMLKIVVNGNYGKLGSPYSAIYAPQLMLGVTFTGQLSLLMLIERLAHANIEVISANTDGLTIAVRDEFYQQVVSTWEAETGFDMEAVKYKSIHYRDCNNYFALTEDGKVKRKGIFRAADISKNPVNEVCVDAAIAYIRDGTDLGWYIRNETDVRKFLTLRTVKGGAVKDGEAVGKAVRWYYSVTTDTPILYATNGNTVARSVGARPMMNLTEHVPLDIDWSWYEREARDLLLDVGVVVK